LRHTFASLPVALGVDPGAVMDQLGHADAGFTLRVYRHAMRRTPAARAALQALVGAPDWALAAVSGLTNCSGAAPRRTRKSPLSRDLSPSRRADSKPLTYRLQGDNSVRLNQQVLPAKSHVSGMRAEAEFRLT
jgi:hypothetical protein